MQFLDLTTAPVTSGETQADGESASGGGSSRFGWVTRMASDSATGGLSRLYLVMIFACFLAICLAQAPGKIQFDTSLPLVLSPISYFNTVLHLWNPTDFGGSVAEGADSSSPRASSSSRRICCTFRRGWRSASGSR